MSNGFECPAIPEDETNQRPEEKQKVELTNHRKFGDDDHNECLPQKPENKIGRITKGRK